MADDDPTKPLHEWNRLTRENRENAIVSTLFDTILGSSPSVDAFATWLLAGSGAIAAILVTNADSLLPVLGTTGFRVAGALLVASCFFGVLSKLFALNCRIGYETNIRIRELLLAHLAEHEKDEGEIQKSAQFWGVEVDSGLRIERILSEYTRPFPFWVKWLMARHIEKHQGDPQIGHLLPLNHMRWQGYFLALQVLLFLAFLIAGVSSAQSS